MEKAEVQRQWEAAAPGWAKWEAVISTWAEPATKAMLDMAGVVAGAKVLDLACGAGSQTLSAARRVGRAGQVVASDISETMLAHARENARAAGLANILTLCGAAEELELARGDFDAVICRLGLMLFAEPAKALLAVRQALKPGGKVAVIVFTNPAANPSRSKAMQILLRHAGKTPPAPGRPGLYSLGAPGTIERLLTESGFAGVVRRDMAIPIRMRSAADALQMVQESAAVFRAVVADCSEGVRAAAWAEVGEMLKTFETGDGFVAPAELLVAAGTKPA
jgi:ubiquinone/menaquinone biosynthesis C-methylase UbiE